MGLFIQKNDDRSELQQRVAERLREKAKQQARIDEPPNDGVDDSAYLRGTKQTTSLAWVWALIFLAIVAAVVVTLVSVND